MKVTYLKPSDKRCPVCGSYHIQGVSRITGYLSLNERFGDGKVNERKLRRDHTAGHDFSYNTSEGDKWKEVALDSPSIKK